MSPKHLPDTYEGKLDHIIEEASEVIKAAIKIKRFGLVADKKYNNLRDLMEEVEDVQKAFDNFINYIDNES